MLNIYRTKSACHYLTVSSDSSFFSIINRAKSGRTSLLDGIIYFSNIYRTKSGRYVITKRPHLFFLYIRNEKRSIFWKRFIDDIISMWDTNRDKIEEFVLIANSSVSSSVHANRVPRYLFNHFNVRNHDISCYKTTSSNDLILEKVNLECTKRALFCNYF